MTLTRTVTPARHGLPIRQSKITKLAQLTDLIRYEIL
jgi:hypothetical protein